MDFDKGYKAYTANGKLEGVNTGTGFVILGTGLATI
jgi:hypothetical protein